MGKEIISRIPYQLRCQLKTLTAVDVTNMSSASCGSTADHGR